MLGIRPEPPKHPPDNQQPRPNAGPGPHPFEPNGAMAPERPTTMTNFNPATPVQTREDYLREQEALSRSPQVGYTGDTYAAMEVRDNRVTTEHRKRTTEAFAADVHTDRVTVNGMEMLRSTYIDMLARGAIPAGSKVDDPTARRLEAEARADGSFEADVPGNAEGDVEKDGKTEDANPADAEVFKSGQSALDAARAELGADAVQSLVGEAVASGDLEAVNKALEGGTVTPAQVGKVYAAYVASAQSIISDTGMSVETMSEVLGEDDLRAAREAVVKGDVSRVQDMASKAVDTLASLPETNPKAFQEYVDRRFPDLAHKVVNGKTMVATNQGWMPFDSLVRSGLLRNAKVDPTLTVGDDE